VSRWVSATNQAFAEAQNVLMCLAADLDFASGAVRCHDGIGTIQINGQDYSGLGTLGTVDGLEESFEVIARPVTLNLSAEASAISNALNESTSYQGRRATLYLAIYNPNTHQLADTPETVWEGVMSQMTIVLEPKNSRIELVCEHRLRRDPRIARYTDADQQLAYSGDRFFDLVGKIKGFRGTWGAKGVANDGYVRTGNDLNDLYLRKIGRG
jgi:hypothetical protein